MSPLPATHLSFPAARLRRTRMHTWSRALVRETRLQASDLILPLFVRESSGRTPVPTLPGVFRLSIDETVATAREAQELGISAVALFPVIDAALKSPGGDEALNPDNLICRAIRALKKMVPDLGVIADVALDPFTSHGQDGVLADGHVDNDATVALLCHQAVVQAAAGCDIVAPSDMMDGRIGAIRNALEANGFIHTLILSYSAKYASGLYGPFRDAVDSAHSLGGADKRSYQMDPANSDEALREAALDVVEGADILMVKPALPYLDIVYRLSRDFPLPVFAYQVSGEYAMLRAAADAGMLNADEALLECLTAIRRAGARAIITYGALEAARLLTK